MSQFKSFGITKELEIDRCVKIVEQEVWDNWIQWWHCWAVHVIWWRIACATSYTVGWWWQEVCVSWHDGAREYWYKLELEGDGRSMKLVIGAGSGSWRCWHPLKPHHHVLVGPRAKPRPCSPLPNWSRAGPRSQADWEDGVVEQTYGQIGRA